MLCKSGGTFAWTVDSLDRLEELCRADKASVTSRLLNRTAYPLIEETLATVQTLKVQRSKHADLIQIPSMEDIKELLVKQVFSERPATNSLKNNVSYVIDKLGIDSEEEVVTKDVDLDFPGKA